MQVIPVIDLKGGVVVHAHGGNRTAYAPLNSPLAQGSDPLAVVEGLMRLHPFETLYVADLDGIMQGEPDLSVLRGLTRAFDRLEIWLDAGLRRPSLDVRQFQDLKNVRLVIGTETLQQRSDYVWLRDAILATTVRAPILSLDFKGSEILGADVFSSPELWPDTVIAMTLDNVGAKAGPDTKLISQLRAATRQTTQIVAAGGVRARGDLVVLAAAGANAALVATALHAETLKASDLEEIAGLPTTL